MKRYSRVFGPAAGLFAVAALMALAPAAGALTVHKTTVLVPAWKGAATSLYSSVGSQGCGSGKDTSPTHWSAVTGNGGWAGTAKMCAKSSPAGNGGSVYWDMYVYVPVHLPTGKHMVTVNWSVIVSGATTFTAPTSCTLIGAPSYAYCDTYVSAYMYAYSYLIDMTNGTYIYPTNYYSGMSSYVSNYTYYSGGTWYYSSSGTAGTFSSSGPVVWFWNYTFVKTHKYVAETGWYSDAYADAYTYQATVAGGGGSASLNAATLGNGVDLTSISIT